MAGETLDRDFTDYSSYKKYLGPLGAKRIRLQAGWAKTEQVKGVYNWAWLDTVIDDAISLGLKPWLEFSYGNPVYEGGGNSSSGSPVPASPESIAAWQAWVKATVERYRSRVTEWEIWNEPNHKNHIEVGLYANLYIASAKVIKAAQPNAKMIALALAGLDDMDYVSTFMERMKTEDLLTYIDIISYHDYPSAPESNYKKVARLKNIIERYSSKISLWQGESGCPSTANSSGAQSENTWTEVTQAKWILRRLVDDLGHQIEVSSIFQISDMIGYNGKKDNTKGLLKAMPDKSIAYAKPSYYAMQNVTSLFNGKFDVVARRSDSISSYCFKKRGENKFLLALWDSKMVPQEHFAVTKTNVEFPGVISKPVMIDLLNGYIYQIPISSYKVLKGKTVFSSIDISDSPLVICDSSLVME